MARPTADDYGAVSFCVHRPVLLDECCMLSARCVSPKPAFALLTLAAQVARTRLSRACLGRLLSHNS